jgi:hypothetical protein
MESLGKEDHELDLDHPSTELLPFFQTLYSGNYHTLTDENVLGTLKLAHKFDTTQLDAACQSYLLDACPRLEAIKSLRTAPLSLLSATVQLQNHCNLRDLHEKYVDALCRQFQMGRGSCANCRSAGSSSPMCPWGSSGCVKRTRATPFANQKPLLQLINLSTALRIIHNLDGDFSQCLQA